MPAIFKPGGVGQYYECQGFEGKLVEVHTSTCAHCQTLTEFPSKKRMMEFVEVCRKCMKLTCLCCAGLPCMPFDARATREEREAIVLARLMSQQAELKAQIEDRWRRG